MTPIENWANHLTDVRQLVYDAEQALQAAEDNLIEAKNRSGFFSGKKSYLSEAQLFYADAVGFFGKIKTSDAVKKFLQVNKQEIDSLYDLLSDSGFIDVSISKKSPDTSLSALKKRKKAFDMWKSPFLNSVENGLKSLKYVA